MIFLKNIKYIKNTIKSSNLYTYFYIFNKLCKKYRNINKLDDDLIHPYTYLSVSYGDDFILKNILQK